MRAASLSAIVVVFGVAEASAQQAASGVRIGFLSNFTESGGTPLVNCFTEALAKFGWVEGRNVTYVRRWAGGRSERYAPLADELANAGLNLIAVNSTPATQAMRRATAGKTVPVVFMSVSDPVESGLVSSLARPGGNLTGVSNFFPATAGKLVDYLRELTPSIKRVIVIRDAANQGKTLDVAEVRASGQRMGIEVIDKGVRGAADIRERFNELASVRPDGIIVLVDGVTLSNRDLIIELVGGSKLPAIYQVRDFVDAGGLFSYGLNFCQHFARAAHYANSILQGGRPESLPVELPSNFELVLNEKAARSLSLRFPDQLVSFASDVIE